MKMILEKENFLKNNIRDLIAVNPLASIRGIQKNIKERTGHSISDKYVSKLIYQIRKKAIIESDRKELNERLSEVRERYRILSKNLLATIYWNWESLELHGIQRPKEKDRQSAIKLLAQMELALFKMELDVGTFENSQSSIKELLQQGSIINIITRARD